MRRFVLVTTIAISTAAGACNLIADIEPATERALQLEGGADGGDEGGLADAPMETGPACTTSTDCAASAPACSDGACVAVASLGRGNSFHNCAVMKDGSLWCWGGSANGQVGTGRVENVPFPTRVAFLPPKTKVAQVTLGASSTCVRTVGDGYVYCWGTSTAGGNSLQPTQAYLPRKAIDVSAGSGDACAVLDDGDVYCWGENGNGEIGCEGDAGALPGGGSCAALSGSHPLAGISAPRLLARGGRQVAVGGSSTCVAASDGKAMCWGDGRWGALGGSTTTAPSADCCGFVSDVVLPPGFSALGGIEATELYVCGHDGIVFHDWCWGNNESCVILGQPCPDPYNDPVAPPVLVDFGSGIGQLAPGWRHTCALVAGEVRCWGDNSHGQMGDGTSGNYAVASPRVAKNLSGTIVDLASHRHFTCALQDDGRVLCWGGNPGGSLGTGDSADHPSPSPVRWQ